MTPTIQIALDNDPDHDDLDYEIVDGQKEAKMAGARHGRVCGRLIARLVVYVESHDLGGIYTPDTTFKIGSNERLPDIAFVSASRIPADGEPEGLWQIAPDLAIEVISPNDIWEKVTRKIEDYFAAGVQQVWLVSLRQRTVSIYDSPTIVTILTEDEELVNERLLPGFRCRIGDIFGKPMAATIQEEGSQNTRN